MQSGKKAMESVKESAANVAASAKAGMDKTKATVQEKVFPFFIFPSSLLSPHYIFIYIYSVS